MYRPNTLKQRLAAGKKVLGYWTGTGSPIVAEVLALTGLDFLVFDQEHGLGGPESLVAQLHAISGTAATSIVRVPWNDQVYLKRVLDAGVESVMIPNIETAEDAAAAVAACRYPPAGRRGAAIGSVRASNFGLAAGYGDSAADNLLIICQIESARAVGNIAEIAAVDGVDVLFIGPFDLSGSYGHLGNIGHPDVAAAIAQIEAAAKRAGKALGTVPHPGLSWQDMFERGYDMVNAGSDVRCLRDAGLAAVEAFRAAHV